MHLHVRTHGSSNKRILTSNLNGNDSHRIFGSVKGKTYRFYAYMYGTLITKRKSFSVFSTQSLTKVKHGLQVPLPLNTVSCEIYTVSSFFPLQRDSDILRVKMF